MRRKHLLAAAAAGGAALSAGIALFTLPTAHSASDNGPPAVPVEVRPAVPHLPIQQVVLFSSGVGYFQREGEIQGNARVDLSFPVQDINDLLKSMILTDEGGQVSAVSYDSQAPLEKTLKSFAVNLTNNPTFGQILNQTRGERVEAILQQTAAGQPANMVGVVMGVEKKKESVNKEAIESEFLNLWCNEGMRSVKLADVQRVRFLNPTVDSVIKKALETLALSHDTQKKAVSLSFTGEGKRQVKVGYVVENPIWKTSYRLVLDDKKKPFLQGWAVVENTQEEDWHGVRMTLVSGRPISFQMDLYQPLFVPRPVVEPELFASLRPPTYSGAMDKPQDGAAFGGGLGGPGKDMARAAEKKSATMNRREARDEAVILLKEQQNALDPRKGVTAAASSGSLGDFFQYKIENGVTLPRQKSALLPIMNEDVEASKVSIYNQNTHAKFPLLGLKFKNTTKNHLMQGPITVLENQSYAGDARILDLQPKEERLISYAIDLGTEVEPIVPHTPDRITKVKINKGIVETTTKIQTAKTYKIKNRSEHDRVVLIEHPYRQDFKLVTPEKFSERAQDVYRFEVKVAAGKDAKQDVREERDVQGTVQLSNSDSNQIRFFLSQQAISEAVKKALQDALVRKAKVTAATDAIKQHERRLNDIRADQERLRNNINAVPKDSEAYKRYVKKFDVQETEIEQIQETVKSLQEKEFAERQAFEKYLSAITLD